MADRSLTVRLRAEVDQFRRDMDSAAQGVGGVGDAAKRAGEQQREVSRLGEAARATGRTLAAVGTAAAAGMAALAANVGATGLAYNSLEQTTRAALATLMGSTEAAEQQMDQLREIVATRMFPREVFIEAQRQMLAFGFAAEDVIPALAAIEDATVAVGGGADDMREIVNILSQMQSTGDITGQELNQLGSRGLNAAQLIGQAMGRTENEIRDSITAGAIDGRQAVAALVDAMENEFAGAAEAVAQTWTGAVGLVSAGFRDMGSLMVEAFVDPTGGGAAVQWARDFAEILYAINRQLRPLVDELRTRAEPAFAVLSERLAAAADWIDQLDLVSLYDQASDLAPALGGVAGALGAAGSAALLSAIPGLGGLAGAISPVGAAIAGVVAASPELRELLFGLVEAVAPLIPLVTEVGVSLGTLASTGLQAVVTLLGPAVELVAAVVDAFMWLPGPVQQGVVAIGAFVAALRFGGPIGAAIAALTTLGLVMETFNLGVDDTSVNVQGLAGDIERMAATGRQTGALAEIFGTGAAGAEEFADKLAVATASFWNWSDNLNRTFDEIAAADQAFDDLDAALTQVVRAGGDADEIFDQLVDTYDLTEDQVDELLELLPGFRAEWERQAEAARDVEESYDAVTGATERATAAAKEHHDQLRAQADPVFALHRALRDAESAQQGLTDAIEEHGEKSPEAEEAALALLDATLGLQGAALEASGAINDEFIDSMIESMEAAGLSEQAIGLVEDALRGVADAGEQIEDEYLTTVTIDDPDQAISDLEAISSAVSGIDRWVDIQVRAFTSPVIPHQAPADSQWVFRQHGGPIDEGPHGVDRVPAMLTRGEHVWTVREVEAAGGHQAVEQIRAAVLAGQTRHAVPAMASPAPMASGVTPRGVVVENMTVQAWSDRFDLRQVEQELAMGGAA